MAETKSNSERAAEIAKKQGTVWYQMKKSKTSYLMLAPYFILFFLFTVLPVVMAVGFSFTYYNMLEMPQFVGWKNYIKLFLEDDIFMKSLKNTLILAVITGPVSYFLCSPYIRHKRKNRIWSAFQSKILIIVYCITIGA